jgi:two-component system CheB/CheR fusion protein
MTDDVRVAPSVIAAAERAFEANDTPQIVLDTDRRVILANRCARDLFGLGQSDLGRPLQDLELSRRPVDLHSLLDQAAAGDDRVVTSSARWDRDGDATYWDVTVAALTGDERPAGTLITFTDVTVRHGMQEELERHQRELKTAYGELQSTVEELETTNEELQSSMEELETMNAELQSSNDELATMNDELRQRSSELDKVNLFLESVLASLQSGVVVTDAQLHVQIWNRASEQLWGLSPDEVRGQDVMSLDIGLPVDQLREPMQAILAGRSEREWQVLDATDRAGRAITCHVSIMPLAQGEQVQGLIILMNARERA